MCVSFSLFFCFWTSQQSLEAQKGIVGTDAKDKKKHLCKSLLFRAQRRDHIWIYKNKFIGLVVVSINYFYLFAKF